MACFIDRAIRFFFSSTATAKNVVKYREENGMFTSRKQILKVPKLGPKAFEQCAGFLRVPESKSVLDNTHSRLQVL